MDLCVSADHGSPQYVLYTIMLSPGYPILKMPEESEASTVA